MLTHGRTFLAWSCFAFVIAAFALIGTFSPSYQKCTARHERDYGQNKQSDLREPVASAPHFPLFLLCEGAFIDENNGTLTALATVAIAGFTLILWQATSRQAKLTRDAIELGNREFAATHRPKIRVAYIKIGPLQATLHPTAEIWAINIGDTDARIIEMGADIFPRRIGFAGLALIGAAPKPYPDVPRVAPGQQANLQVRGGLPLTQQIIDGIHGQQAPGVANLGVVRTIDLCVVGTIHYLDDNGTRRLTSFFRIYNPDRLRFKRAPEDDEYAEWEYEA
jgi:hypothetical protein